MAKLTNAQLQAVVNTIKSGVEKNKENLREEFKVKLQKDKSYKQLISLFEEKEKVENKAKELEIQAKELEIQDKDLANKIHNLVEGDTYTRHYYNYEFYYKDVIINRYVDYEIKKVTEIKDIDYNSIKNEILVASIDRDFDIQRFIDKYTN